MDARADPPSGLSDRYRIERELGNGATAVVYLAYDLRHDRHVAIKVLRPELTSGFSSDRFLREIRISASLQHPNILSLFDSGEADGSVYCVMPYVNGETLRARLKREKALPVEEALRLTRQIADALAYAHAQGVVHRDIKPENILLAGGQAFVADFGIAHSITADSSERLTLTGMSLGTPHYMSPEQASGERDVDGRSDIYSLGCVTYEMLAGEAPFDGPNAQAVIARHLQQPAPSVRIVRHTVPEHVDVAVQRALAKAAVDRFPNAAAFAAALDDSRALSPSAMPRRSRLTPWTIALPLAAAFVVALFAGRALWSRVAGPEFDADLIAIAPFDVADAAFAPQSVELLGLLAANLNGAGPLRVVPPTRVVGAWTGRADEASAIALGRRNSARFSVVGAIQSRGADSVRLTAALYDADSHRLHGDLQIVVLVGRMDRAADSLAVGIIELLGRERHIGSSRPPSSGPSAMAALKSYLQGEVAYRRMDWDAAQPLYQRAADLDTNYALAFHRLAQVRVMKGSGIDSLIWFNGLRAGRLHRGLPERDSLVVMIDSLQAALWYALTVPTAGGSDSLSSALSRRLFATHEVATRRYPDDPELWYLLSVNLGNLAGPDPRRHHRTLEALNRTIALDSSFLPAYRRAINLASTLHGPDSARRYIRAYLNRDVDGPAADGARLLDLLFDPKRSAGKDTERLLAASPPNLLREVWGPLLWWYDSSETAARVARQILGHPDAARLDPRGISYPKFLYALTLGSRGHARQACREMSEAPHWVLFPQLALLKCAPTDSADAKIVRLAEGYRWRPSRVVLWVPWWAAIGDTARLSRLRAHGDSISRSATDDASRTSARVLSASARAYLALARHDTTEALARFRETPDTLCQFCDAQRLDKARLLGARGFTRQAIDVLSGDLDGNNFPLAFLLRLQRARFSEQVGDLESALDDYARVAGAWARGDPAMRDSAEVARLAVERLRRER